MTIMLQADPSLCNTATCALYSPLNPWLQQGHNNNNYNTPELTRALDAGYCEHLHSPNMYTLYKAASQQDGPEASQNSLL